MVKSNEKPKQDFALTLLWYNKKNHVSKCLGVNMTPSPKIHVHTSCDGVAKLPRSYSSAQRASRPAPDFTIYFIRNKTIFAALVGNGFLI